MQLAIEQRKPQGGSLIHHSDRGCQYTSDAFSTVDPDAGHYLLDEPHRLLLRQRRGKRRALPPSRRGAIPGGSIN
jgi:hypothetical protein